MTILKNPNKFYVYRHIRLDTGTVFYVGKGTGFRYKSNTKRNRFWGFIVKKYGHKVEIVKYFDDEAQALILKNC